MQAVSLEVATEKTLVPGIAHAQKSRMTIADEDQVVCFGIEQ